MPNRRDLGQQIHGEIAYMTAPTLTIGTRIDVVPSNLWHSRNISPGALRTIQDLLTALQSDTQISMLRTTAGHVAACLSQRLDQLAIDVLVDVAPQFTAYLMARHHKRNAVRSYRNYANMLVRKAKELGWEPSKSVVPAEWDAVC